MKSTLLRSRVARSKEGDAAAKVAAAQRRAGRVATAEGISVRTAVPYSSQRTQVLYVPMLASLLPRSSSDQRTGASLALSLSSS